jgi:hypothetical protein
MRFFFHVLGNGITVEDGSGTVLPSPEAARLYASVIAGELAQDGNQYRGCDVCAVDEVGNEIARLSVVVPS